MDHSHSWIQLASCRLFGLLFSAWKIDEIVSHSGDDLDYIQKDVFNKVEQVHSYVCCCEKVLFPLIGFFSDLRLLSTVGFKAFG